MLDLRGQLAALPRHPDARRQDTPLRPSSITFHFSDVAYTDRSPAAERRRVFAEARHHLAKNWNTRPTEGPVYLSRYQYHWVVFSDGEHALCNDLVQLAHCGNQLGNAASIATHVMLGKGQRLTPPQRDALYELWDALRAEHGIPRTQVYGHCEWPRGVGPAIASTAFAPMPRQSTCPERILFRDLVSYRAMADGQPGTLYRARADVWVRPTPSTAKDRTAILRAGQTVRGRAVAGETVTRPGLGTSAEWVDIGYGFVWRPQLDEVGASLAQH